MIILENVEKTYSSSFCLRVDSLRLDRGERLSLIGMNGSGKSTLLGLIAGTVRPDGGRIRTEGEERIGYLPQHPYVFRGSVRDNVRLSAASDAACSQMLRAFDLEGLAERRAASLSGGEKQRMFLAGMLAGRFTTLLLDEPLSSVDVGTAQNLNQTVLSLCEERGITLVAATHLPAHVLSMNGRLLFLDRGRAVPYDDASSFAESEDAFVKRFISQWKWR